MWSANDSRTPSDKRVLGQGSSESGGHTASVQGQCTALVLNNELDGEGAAHSETQRAIVRPPPLNLYYKCSP